MSFFGANKHGKISLEFSKKRTNKIKHFIQCLTKNWKQFNFNFLCDQNFHANDQKFDVYLYKYTTNTYILKWKWKWK
jgi:hypothetical protein